MPEMAKQDAVVEQEVDHGVKIQRLIFAGTQVPPDLVDAYNKAVGASPDNSDAEDYSSLTVEELQALADGRDVTVEGTGKDGNVLKSDLVRALQADDSE